MTAFQHLTGDAYNLGDIVVYASSIDAFSIQDYATANTLMEVLAHWAAIADDPNARIKAQRKILTITKKWPEKNYKGYAESVQNKLAHANNREQQWIGMLEKLIDTISFRREHCHTEVRELANRYRQALNLNKMKVEP